jgi:hypothetical protein
MPEDDAKGGVAVVPALEEAAGRLVVCPAPSGPFGEEGKVSVLPLACEYEAQLGAFLLGDV